jgi:hypothetical protein
LAVFIAILMVADEMPKHVQITGSDTCPCSSRSSVVVFNAIDQMDHLIRELKLLLRLVLILIGEVASFISTRISTGGQLRMKIFQALRLLSFVNWIRSLRFVCIGRDFSVEISSVRLGREKYHE